MHMARAINVEVDFVGAVCSMLAGGSDYPDW